MGRSVARKNTARDRILKEGYFNPRNPASYGGKSKLVEHSKKFKNISKENVTNWLQSQDAYTLHKSARKRFPRRPTIVGGEGQQLQADLIDMQKFKSENDGHTFILTVIDVFSKFAWTAGIKSKTGTNVAKALKKILLGNTYHTLQTDKGKEFYNAHVKSLLVKMKINHFSTENDDIKASIVERFNRTIQSRLHRYFTKFGSRRWINVLGDLTSSYNNSVHTSTQRKPIDVDSTNSEEVWLNLYGDTQRSKYNSKLKVNDHVRISKFKHVFSKGYDKNWSTEIFMVDKVNNTSPITYSLRDQMNEQIIGTYYHEELQKVALPKKFVIDTILKTRKYKGNTQYYVKYKGYPQKFNEWINKSQLS